MPQRHHHHLFLRTGKESKTKHLVSINQLENMIWILHRDTCFLPSRAGPLTIYCECKPLGDHVKMQTLTQCVWAWDFAWLTSTLVMLIQGLQGPGFSVCCTRSWLFDLLVMVEGVYMSILSVCTIVCKCKYVYVSICLCQYVCVWVCMCCGNKWRTKAIYSGLTIAKESATITCSWQQVKSRQRSGKVS